MKILNFYLNQLNFEIDTEMMLLREYKHKQTVKKIEKVQPLSDHQTLEYFDYNLLLQTNFSISNIKFHNFQRKLSMNMRKYKEVQQKII